MNLKTERVELRLDEETVTSVDSWRAKLTDIPSRSEAIRRLIELGLRQKQHGAQISDGERLVVMMLCDMYKLIAPNVHALHLGRDWTKANLKCPLPIRIQKADKLG